MCRRQRLLEIQGLKKRYGETVALNDCSFSVDRGRVLGFLGRNGAGKTTTMRSIFGLVQLDAGSMRWQGKPVDREARFRFGYMPEERGLYPRMKVQSQMEYFGQLRGLEPQTARQETERWLQRLELSDRRNSTVDSLSHGNQQKVQLGVSLVGDPDLLVLDEPFSGLDPIAVEVLSSVIQETASRGTAVVFSSHQLELVGGVCDDIAVITRGHVVLSGDLDDIRRNSPTRLLELRLDTRVEYDWASDLATKLPGSTLEQSDADQADLTVVAGTKPADVISALGDLAPRVMEFRLEPPDLEHLFRRAIGESQ
jgi:ABC-2 type transport system ATP-binding protein